MTYATLQINGRTQAARAADAGAFESAGRRAIYERPPGRPATHGSCVGTTEHLMARSLAAVDGSVAEPFKPQALSPSQAAVANLFYCTASRSEMRSGERSYVWTWRLDARRTRMRSAVEFSSPAGNVLLTLANDCRLQDDWDVDWRPHVGDARLLAWTLYYEPVILHLCALLGVDLEPVAVLDMIERGAERIRVDFDLADAAGVSQLTGSLYLPAGASAESFPGLRGDRARCARAADVPVRLRIHVAQCDIAARELAGLLPGDAVVIGSASLLSDASRVTLAAADSGTRLIAALKGRGSALELTHILPQGGSDRSLDEGRTTMLPPAETISSPNPTDTAPLDVSGLPVTLSFEAGTLDLSVGELSSLNPGTVLVLDRKLTESPVTIRANGRAMARGEFVTINDFLAVRIVDTAAYGPE